MSKPIRFERQYNEKLRCTIVALDARLSDFDGKVVTENGKLAVRLPEETIKDCRLIDGCVYLHLGRVSDDLMVGLIELYQKVANSDKWTENAKSIVPDEKLNLGL